MRFGATGSRSASARDVANWITQSGELRMISGLSCPRLSEDVKAVALPVLRHRIVRNYKAEADGIGVDDLIKGLL